MEFSYKYAVDNLLGHGYPIIFYKRNNGDEPLACIGAYPRVISRSSKYNSLIGDTGVLEEIHRYAEEIAKAEIVEPEFWDELTTARLAYAPSLSYKLLYAPLYALSSKILSTDNDSFFKVLHKRVFAEIQVVDDNKFKSITKDIELDYTSLREAVEKLLDGREASSIAFYIIPPQLSGDDSGLAYNSFRGYIELVLETIKQLSLDKKRVRVKVIVLVDKMNREVGEKLEEDLGRLEHLKDIIARDIIEISVDELCESTLREIFAESTWSPTNVLAVRDTSKYLLEKVLDVLIEVVKKYNGTLWFLYVPEALRYYRLKLFKELGLIEDEIGEIFTDDVIHYNGLIEDLRKRLSKKNQQRRYNRLELVEKISENISSTLIPILNRNGE